MPIRNYRVVQWRRGTTAENDGLTGAEGEITVDLEARTLRVHDGIRQGGTVLRKFDDKFNRQQFVSFKAAVTQQGVASLAMSTLNNPPTPISVVTPGGVATAVARFAQNAGEQLQGSFTIPPNWPLTDISCQIVWRTSNTSLPVTWKLDYGGVEDGELIDTFAFNAYQIFPPFVPSTANQMHTSSVVLEDYTGIVPGGEFFFRLGRSNDATPAMADLLSIRFTLDRQDF